MVTPIVVVPVAMDDVLFRGGLEALSTSEGVLSRLGWMEGEH